MNVSIQRHSSTNTSSSGKHIGTSFTSTRLA